MPPATPGAPSHRDPEARAAEADPGVTAPTVPIEAVPADAAPIPVLTPGDEALKLLLKDAVAEALREQRALIQSVVEDALEEMAFAEALREVEAHERRFSRHAGFRAVEGEA